MKMKPILFNTEMVRAILDGQKTVTRRVIKPQPEGAHCVLDYDEGTRSYIFLCGNRGTGGILADWEKAVKMPYHPGDILYVRETFATLLYRDGHTRHVYKATDTYPFGEAFVLRFRWHPSIHMPKEAARIFLRVTDVRAERLQDIDYEGCKSEGIWDDYKTYSEKYHENLARRAYLYCFSELWDSTIKKADRPKYGWAANPWVWVIEFERISKEEAEYGTAD